MNLETRPFPIQRIVRALSYFALGFVALPVLGHIDVTHATPYQATSYAQCPTSVNCVVSFPKVAAGKRLDLRFASCEITGGPYPNQPATVANTRIYMQTGTKPVVQENLRILNPYGISYQYAGDSSSGYYYTAVSQPVFFSIAQGEKVSFVAWPLRDSNDSLYEYVDNITCTVHGDLADASSPAPYQATAHAQCPHGVNCVVKFPALPYALDVQFVSCQIFSASTTSGRFYLQTVQDGHTFAMPLDMPYDGYQVADNNTFYGAISQPVSFLVPAQQALQIFGWPSSGYFFDRMDCTVGGAPQ